MTLTLGQTPPDFELDAAGGGRVGLEAGGAPATVVVFTCNHCPYALAWHDRINAVARDYADFDVRILQINSNDPVAFPADSFEAMVTRVEAGEFSSPYLFDSDQSVARAWDAQVTPHVFVLDGGGRLVYRGAPDGDHAEESLNAVHLRDALDDVLGGAEVRVAESDARGCRIKWAAA